MKTSSAGLAVLTQREGRRNQAYLDSRGIPTIGVGHTGPEVRLGLAWSDEQVEAALASDVAWAENEVNRCVNVPMTQNQFDALVSFVFNLGSRAFSSSTLLKSLNSGSYMGAATQFPRWDLVAGRQSEGLLRRRVAEQELFTRRDV